MRLLDLFCGAGGAAVGYSRAGFDEIVGVDNRLQKNYPFTFVQADALEYVAVHGQEFDAIHASPPCQAFTVAKSINGRTHPDLLTPCRQLLESLKKPYVLENVPGAPMRIDAMLCGSMFKLGVKRHRWFEANWAMPPCVQACRHDWPEGPVGVYGHSGSGSTRYGSKKCGNHGYTVADWRRAMGIDWMTGGELTQAIPPAYTNWIGQWLLEKLVSDLPPMRKFISHG